VLYFDSMAKEESCWKIELKRELKVSTSKNVFFVAEAVVKS
jgi:hypothetical protein